MIISFIMNLNAVARAPSSIKGVLHTVLYLLLITAELWYLKGQTFWENINMLNIHLQKI